MVSKLTLRQTLVIKSTFKNVSFYTVIYAIDIFIINLLQHHHILPVEKLWSKWSRSLTVSKIELQLSAPSCNLSLFQPSLYILWFNSSNEPKHNVLTLWAEKTNIQKAVMPETRNNKRTNSARKGQKLDAEVLVHWGVDLPLLSQLFPYKTLHCFDLSMTKRH